MQNEKKVPLFVKVYETIYNRLIEGRYLPGEQLPPESELAEELNVSRGTLRQALLLLQEDGMIMNHQGKGSIVLERSRKLDSGIERLNNPLITYPNVPINQIHTEIQFQIATDKHRKQFGLEPSTLLALIEIIYTTNDTPTGLSQIFMPYDVLSENQVALDDKEAVYLFYNEFITRDKLYSDGEVRFAYARKSTAAMLKIKEGAPMLMMEENIYQANRVVVFQKHFMLPNYYELKLQRYNDRKNQIGSK